MPFDVIPFRWALRSQKVVTIPKRTKQLLESCLVRPAMQNFAKHVRAVALERPRHPTQHAALSALGISTRSLQRAYYLLSPLKRAAFSSIGNRFSVGALHDAVIKAHLSFASRRERVMLLCRAAAAT